MDAEDLARDWLGTPVQVFVDNTNQFVGPIEFYGYEVCDEGFLSALWNMGYAYDEDEISKQLNENFLFAKRSDAIEFASFSNREAPEHAPFWVLRIDRILDPR